MRFKQCFVRQLFRFYMGRDETPGDDPVLRQMFFGFAHQRRRRTSSAAARCSRARPASRSARRRHETAATVTPHASLIKRFGLLAFVLTPVARAMGYVAGGTFVGAPRFVMFFKGGVVPSGLHQPVGDHQPRGHAARAAAPHAQDIILFKNMSIHGGSPKTDGYQEEHGAGLIGCVTGNSYHYSKNDSYYAYTDNESIDIAHRQPLPDRPRARGAAVRQPAHRRGRALRRRQRRPRPALHLVSASARPATRSTATPSSPIQDAGQVYDTLMQRVNLHLLGARRTSPPPTTRKLRAALERKKSLIDFRLAGHRRREAGARHGLGHAQKLDGLVDGWREVESA